MSRVRHFYPGHAHFCGCQDIGLRVSINTCHVTCPDCLAKYRLANGERLTRLAWERMLTKRQRLDRDRLRYAK